MIEAVTHFINRIRPQVLLAIAVLGSVTLYALYLGHIEVATGSGGGVIAISMKLLEGEN
jgi:hypothetical protein